MSSGVRESMTAAGSKDLARAREALGRGQLDESLAAAKAALRREPRSVLAWQLVGQVLVRAKRWGEASDAVARALAFAPDDASLRLQQAQVLAGMGRPDEAVAIAEALTRQDWPRADWYDALGSIFAYAERPEEARTFFERAVQVEPRNTFYLYNLATAQRMTGDLPGAEDTLDRVLAFDPDDAQAHHLRADLRVQTAARNHIAAIHAALGRSRDPTNEIVLSFALAKELEDVADYDRSFESLKRGCDLQRRRMSYAVSGDVAAINRIVERHDRVALGGGIGSDMEAAIFVFGLPRSGTTLVERILASHSAVHGGGELTAFPAETIRAVQAFASGPVDKLAFADASLAVDPLALGEAYRAATARVGAKAARFTDKLPSNYLYAGLIGRALPRARIVALARDPLDSCYAMYKTLFANLYPFSYDLGELAHYYIAWHRLMRHWRDVLGDQLLIVHYEDLVADQEAISRRILAHCGLDWEPACLLFHRQVDSVTTASASQVRRPIYASSVGKWRHYASHLAGIEEVLAAHAPAGGWRLD